VTFGGFGGEHHAYSTREGNLVDTTEAGVMPPVADDRLYLVAAAGLEPFRAVFDALSQVNVYSINPEEMRRPQKPEAGDLLRRDGSNVASVLERLRRDKPAAKSRIEGYLGQIVAGVTAVDRRGLGAWEALEFRQQVAGDPAPWSFQASSMSDGTLSALGVLVALFGGSSALGVPLGIEEPEAALHPAAAGLLMEALRDATDIRQVLATTHSPELLDSTTIEPQELLAVRASEGITSISGLDPASRKALRESLFTAGELLRVDQLEPDEHIAQQMELFR
jgi:predicted ATPase